ncbi:MAG TPA: alpha-L-arabinofuranosidase C-terminal domain-containing protein [Bryobacteraceae bacterium]|jgi:alpha-N-arabinofuranosidase|nr:alpha-L-arabinofuranosidase C-terminal domain-containing protein [Bryobacteraceae bacterium]
MKTGSFAVGLLCAAGLLAYRGPQTGTRPATDTVSIKINAAKRADFTIPRTIFGSFLEPIGNSTYNGLWAEILQNPSFESGLWSAANVSRMLREQPSLSRASQLALPLPWEPLDPREGNRYEPRRGDAANSFESLEIIGVPDKQTGIKQRIYLPVHRELHYRGSLYVKHLSGAAALDISIRRADAADQVFSSAKIAADANDWRKYTFELELPPGRIQPLEPADFVITVEGDERVLLDEASLLPADAKNDLDSDMIAMAKEMNTPLVRFGGNFTSGYHWRDGIGPIDKRVSMRNIAWGIPEYNTLGTDEFLRFCELIGAEPQIALNLGSGTPTEAADWVRYVNQHWTKHAGNLWELGNELWGDWNLGYPTLEELPGRTAEFSKAVRAVDPEARLIATGQDPDVYQKWNAAQLTNAPGTFDFLSTHFVVTTDRMTNRTATPDEIAAATFALPVGLGRKLRDIQQQINESANFRNKAHIAFTEWLFVCCNGNTPNAPRWDNMAGAIATGGFLNMLMRNADIVPISDMTGIIEFAGIWKKRGRVFATPAYYAFRMFSTADADLGVDVENNAGHYDVHGGVTRLPDITDVPYLDTVAVMNKAKDRLTLFCVNRHLTQDMPATVAISGLAAHGTARIQTLFAESRYEMNDEVEPEHIVPQTSNSTVNNGQLKYTFRHESITRIDFIAAP